MSWSTELFCNITFNRETFNSKSEVEERIEEIERYSQRVRDQIRDLAMMTEPQKFCPENYDPIIWLRNEIQDSLDALEEGTIDLYKLNLLLENWSSCHDEKGLAIEPPDEVRNGAFLEGDFVKTTKCPNANDISRFKNE